MPCYEVNYISVEFKAKHKEVLKQALKNLGYSFRENKDRIYTNYFEFDLKNQKVIMEADFQSDLNKVKQEYSAVAIEAIAKKRRWASKRINQNQFQLVKY